MAVIFLDGVARTADVARKSAVVCGVSPLPCSCGQEPRAGMDTRPEFEVASIRPAVSDRYLGQPVYSQRYFCASAHEMAYELQQF